MLCLSARHSIHIASVELAEKCVPDGNTFVSVFAQCYQCSPEIMVVKNGCIFIMTGLFYLLSMDYSLFIAYIFFVCLYVYCGMFVLNFYSFEHVRNTNVHYIVNLYLMYNL